MSYQLDKSVADKLKDFFNQFDFIDKVVIFGSRAKHNANPKSDIDLCIYSLEMTSKEFTKLKLELDELPILFKMDIVHFENLNYELKDNILRDGKLFFVKTKILKDSIIIQNGYAFKSKEFKENGIPIVRITNVDNNGLNLKSLVYYTENEKLNRFLIKKGDILLSLTGDDKTLKICINNNDEKMYLNQRVAILRAKERVNQKYLFYSMQNNSTDLLNKAKGIAQKNISVDDINSLKITLPSITKQKQIAKILDKAKELIELRKESVNKLDELSKSIFIDMFGDPIENPKKFKIESLSDFFIDEKNGTRCGPFGSALKKEEYVKNGIPVWNMDNISKEGNFIESVNLMVSEKKYTKLNSYTVINGDIIISRAGTVGKMCVVSSKYTSSIISTNLIRLRLDSSILMPLYFVKLMTYCKDRIKRLEVGSDGTLTHMSSKILASIQFPYPEKCLQEKFFEKIKKIEQQKSIYEEELIKLQDNFNALLAQSFKA